MSEMTAKDVLNTTGGQWLVEPTTALWTGGAAIDSRDVGRGDVFFAFVGERVDGHAYVAAAARAGAWAAVVEREVETGDVPDGFGVLRVDSVADALVACARARRKGLGKTRVIAVTGSNGKTTTTRMIDAALGATLRGSASAKSHNNAIGLPMTILNAHEGDDYLVCEIGSNHPGEIAMLGAITEPDIAVITSVARAHMEGFGTIEGVAKEKASLARCVRAGGTVFASAESAELLAALEGVRGVVTYGTNEAADVRLLEVREAHAHTIATIDGIGVVRLTMLGVHNAMNATATMAVARCMGVDLGAAAGALERLKPPPMRLERCEIAGIHVINDAYNANPDSMLAAVRTLGAIEAPGRKVVVLGDMLELGVDPEGVHYEIADEIVASNAADYAVFVGPAMQCAADRVHEAWGDGHVMWMKTLDGGGAGAAASMIESGDTVLLKGSRAMGMERVAQVLGERPPLAAGDRSDS